MSKKPVINYHDFMRDLKRGKEGEQIVQVFCKESFGLTCVDLSNKNPDFDLIIRQEDGIIGYEDENLNKKEYKRAIKKVFKYSRKKDITIEVKFDKVALKYSNFFLEVFFNIETGCAGGMFKSKADILAWVLPTNKEGGEYKIFFFKRPELLAWLLSYVYTDRKVKFKTPRISPYARGVAVPIKLLENSVACIGVYDYSVLGE